MVIDKQTEGVDLGFLLFVGLTNLLPLANLLGAKDFGEQEDNLKREKTLEIELLDKLYDETP